MVGAVTAVTAPRSGWPVLALGILVLGVASSVQLLARFTATDLALPQTVRATSRSSSDHYDRCRCRPELMGPGAWIGGVLGINPLAGVFVFDCRAQLLAATVSWFGLRPDPLLTARDLPAEDVSAAGFERPRRLAH